MELNPKTHAVTVTLASKGEFTPEARLRIEQPATVTGIGKFAPATAYKSEREAYVVPLGAQATTVQLQMK